MPPLPGMTFPIPVDGIVFEAPKSIEVARLTSSTCLKGSGPETLLYIRLECPNIEKPQFDPPKQRRTNLCSLFLCGKFKTEINDSNLAFSKWSYLLQSDEMQNGSSWLRIPTCQQPSNGHIWIRLMKCRICLMVIICGNSTQVDNKSANPSRQSSPTADSLFNLSDDESMNTLEYMFPTTYYFWDSGLFQEEFNASRSRINVANDSVYFTLAPGRSGNNMAWRDNELQMLRTGTIILAEDDRKEQDYPAPLAKPDDLADKTTIVPAVKKPIVPISSEVTKVFEETQATVSMSPEDLLGINNDLMTWRTRIGKMLPPECPQVEPSQETLLKTPNSPAPRPLLSTPSPRLEELRTSVVVDQGKLSPKSRRRRACALVKKNMIPSKLFCSSKGERCSEDINFENDADGDNRTIPLPKPGFPIGSENEYFNPRIPFLKANCTKVSKHMKSIKSSNQKLIIVANHSNVYRKPSNHDNESTARPIQSRPASEKEEEEGEEEEEQTEAKKKEDLSTDNLCSEGSGCFKEDRPDFDAEQMKHKSGNLKKWHFWDRASSSKLTKSSNVREKSSHGQTTQNSFRNSGRHKKTAYRRSTPSNSRHCHGVRKKKRSDEKQVLSRGRNESSHKRLKVKPIFNINNILREHSEELEGMQLIQSQLDNITDEQWNQVIDILASPGELPKLPVASNQSIHQSRRRKQQKVPETNSESISTSTKNQKEIESRKEEEKPLVNQAAITETPKSRTELRTHKREQLRMRQVHANFTFSSHKGKATSIFERCI